MAFSEEQRRNAATIASVGRRMGASTRDILIGLMTAMQESGLRNVDYGDRDSLGLFQQRPSMGWGTPEQVQNPTYAAGKFFEGLLANGDRSRMSLTAAAQAVQRSAFPDAYAKHEGDARSLLSQLGEVGAGGIEGEGATPVRMEAGPDAEAVQNTSRITGAQEAAESLTAPQAMPGAGRPLGLDLVESNPTALTAEGVPELGTPEDEPLVLEEERTSLGPAQDQLVLADPGDGAQVAENTLGPTGVEAPGAPEGAATRGPRTTTDEGFVPLGASSGGGGGGGTGVGAAIAEKALQYKGTPYVWSGESPLGFDCVAGDVLVATSRGLVTIRDVRPGDLVATPAGYRRVLAQWLVGYKRTVLIRSGVGVLECTPDHRVHTQRGWVAAGELVDGDEVTICQDQSGLSSRGTRTTDTLTRRARATGITSRGLPVNSTAPSGRAPTDPCQTGMRPTTLTTTPSTTTFEISQRSLSLSTGGSRRHAAPLGGSSASTAGRGSRRTETLARSDASVRGGASALSATVSTGSVRPVYDLEVEGEHSFFAGGILVHNCSGFTQYVFGQFGIDLPRVSYQQGQGGRAVSMDELQPGDMIFYDTSGRNPGEGSAEHIAIYMGNGKQVEANNPGGRVTVGSVRTDGAWARRYW